MDANTTPPTLPSRNARVAPTLAAQLARFGLVGVGLNGVLFLAYLAFVDRGVDPKLAMSAVYVAGVVLGFVLNRTWTFASVGASRREWGPYLAVYLAGYMLNLAVLALCVDGFGWSHAWVQGAMVLVVAGASFALNRVWVFRAPDH